MVEPIIIDLEKEIKRYQVDCFSNYKSCLGLDENYRFLYGNPINVLVPIEIAVGNYMIVGAYPSAKFFTVQKADGKIVVDVPLYDNDSPFSNESYFDGSRVRTIPSGKELNEVILSQIGIKREDCWITDLVKVFLFKEGHIRRYKELGKTDIEPNRDKLRVYAKASMDWLIQEINLAKPKVIILLGAEVASVVLHISEDEAKKRMTGEIFCERINSKNDPVNIMCLPHPGILMKPSERNPWPERFNNTIAPKARRAINGLENPNVKSSFQ